MAKQDMLKGALAQDPAGTMTSAEINANTVQQILNSGRQTPEDGLRIETAEGYKVLVDAKGNTIGKIVSEEKRTVRVPLVLTPSAKEKLAARAKYEKCSINELVHRLIDDMEPAPEGPVEE